MPVHYSSDCRSEVTLLSQEPLARTSSSYRDVSQLCRHVHVPISSVLKLGNTRRTHGRACDPRWQLPRRSASRATMALRDWAVHTSLRLSNQHPTFPTPGPWDCLAEKPHGGFKRPLGSNRQFSEGFDSPCQQQYHSPSLLGFPEAMVSVSTKYSELQSYRE